MCVAENTAFFDKLRALLFNKSGALSVYISLFPAIIHPETMYLAARSQAADRRQS